MQRLDVKEDIVSPKCKVDPCNLEYVIFKIFNCWFNVYSIYIFSFVKWLKFSEHTKG